MATSSSDFKDAASVSTLGKSNAEFAVGLYQKLSETKSGENIFLSPFSISAALAMTYLGARNETAKQMTDVLKFGALGDSVHTAFEDYISCLRKKGGNYTLSTANRQYAHVRAKLLDDFVKQTGTQYHADILSVDFGKESEKTRQEINSWVESETAGKIKNLIPSGILDDLTRLVLVNAIYFKGDWATQFDPKATNKRPFYMSDGREVTVDMMFKKAKYNFGRNRDLECKMLEMPYKGKDLSMILMLPLETNGITALEKKITIDMLTKLSGQMHNMEVKVSLPKFRLECSFELKDALSALGMPLAFDDNNADFSGIDGTKELYVSNVIHKAFVEVNEEGTEAAAATAVVMMANCIVRIDEFNADHPFLFYIRDNRSNSILFMGRLSQP